MPKHSIVISSYNRPTYIAKSIASVRQQTEADWEAVITDDGSTDETLEVIQSASAGDPRIRLLVCRSPYHAAERGSVLQRYAERINDALAVCSGEVIHYLADDDWYDPGRLHAFDGLFKDSVVMVGYGKLIYVTRNGTPNGEERFPPGPTRDVRWKIDHNQCAHRRSVLEKVPSWPTGPRDFPMDASFFLQLAAHWDFYPVDQVVAYKRIHAFNMMDTWRSTTSQRE